MLTSAVRLAPLLSRYIVQEGAPKTVLIPGASQLAKVQPISVRGILLKKQLVNWDPRTLKPRISIGKRSGRYLLEEDGSLTFCVGARNLQPHIVCRIEDGLPWLSLINRSVGKKVTVAGFLRCSFDNADSRDHARVFEIYPVCAVEIGGELYGVELDVPISLIHDWTDQVNLLDERREVCYWKGTDVLVFSNIEAGQQAYVRESVI